MRFDPTHLLRGLTVCGLLLVAACTSYGPLPLSTHADLAATVSDLREAPSHPITLPELDRLVVANNPDLQASRARLGIGAAQVLLAGILPNPSVPLSYPFLVGGPGTTNGYALGLAQDIKSIILRDSKIEVANSSLSAVSATLLWQEWQTIAKARLLYVDIVSGERALALIAQDRKLLLERFGLTKTAIAQGNATLATLSPDLVAVAGVQRLNDDLERLQLARRHQLNALLGLVPDARLRLAAVPALPVVDPRAVREALGTLADRRPDLVALQYGYRSQDAKVRQAILAQFPNAVVGVLGGSDTTGVRSFGPTLTIDLPVFDRNQGGVALELATRDLLNREFAARVAAAVGEIGSLLAEQALLSRQLARLEPSLQEARSIADRTRTAFEQGTFDERAYVDIAVARLTREQEKVGLQQAILEGQVGLATLVGAGFPRVDITPEPIPVDAFGVFEAGAR